MEHTELLLQTVGATLAAPEQLLQVCGAALALLEQLRELGVLLAECVVGGLELLVLRRVGAGRGHLLLEHVVLHLVGLERTGDVQRKDLDRQTYCNVYIFPSVKKYPGGVSVHVRVKRCH